MNLKHLCGLGMLVLMSTGCATIKFGGEMAKRYDTTGNEIVFITHIDTSRVSGAVLERAAILNGAGNGAIAGGGITALGTSAGALSGGIIAGVITAIKDSGKLKVRITDYNNAEEEAPKNAWDETFRDPWEGWEYLRPQQWAKIHRDADGFVLTACNPACSPVPDASLKITALPPDKQYWVFIRGQHTYKIMKTNSPQAAESMAMTLPPDIAQEVTRLVKERAATEKAAAPG